ncbi:MAG: ribbon-helix-helix protein, CopG family [Lentisphaerae bacterium]|nr:ribbon-helix-helix protein, CopG family [Lentisphaerota bacterium]MBT4818855.1 ribbon-helix-helix protein, CopG family [Lentisphaerota bacterium]MBT5608862.1 ribbon-helix-helix protein, CopG family [Lentisphaerota bacterium]MBT7057012.1 ribbon-helix-helix protein, CopG family [Lentisphaerota bacterium]MBT7848484.1 ribbon-helix-helix protein, CopG family [Lentisphaerota bacterium]
MKTVQMTLDEALVAQVDTAARKLHTSRSGFTRDALRRAIRDLQRRELEEKHRKGYARLPVAEAEFSVWEEEQEWGES